MSRWGTIKLNPYIWPSLMSARSRTAIVLVDIASKRLEERVRKKKSEGPILLAAVIRDSTARGSNLHPCHSRHCESSRDCTQIQLDSLQ